MLEAVTDPCTCRAGELAPVVLREPPEMVTVPVPPPMPSPGAPAPEVVTVQPARARTAPLVAATPGAPAPVVVTLTPVRLAAVPEPVANTPLAPLPLEETAELDRLRVLAVLASTTASSPWDRLSDAEEVEPLELRVQPDRLRVPASATHTADWSGSDTEADLPV